MTNTRRTISMIAAATMILTSLSSLESTAADAGATSNQGYTTTDLDVDVDAFVKGATNPDLIDVETDQIEGEIVHNTVGNKPSDPCIYVEVEWDELVFTYNFGEVQDYVWSTTELKYVPGELVNVGWNKSTADITFTSYSNRDVYCGCSFEKNKENGDVYKDVKVSFTDELHLDSALDGEAKSDVIVMSISDAPSKDIDMANPPSLGKLKFYLSEATRVLPEEPEAEEATTEDGAHVHHWVYDQFGRLVCTGCNEIQHEYCIDEDEDGLCDECGMERDFCPDCHIGGTCKCT